MQEKLFTKSSTIHDKKKQKITKEEENPKLDKDLCTKT